MEIVLSSVGKMSQDPCYKNNNVNAVKDMQYTAIVHGPDFLLLSANMRHFAVSNLFPVPQKLRYGTIQISLLFLLLLFCTKSEGRHIVHSNCNEFVSSY